MSQDVTINNPLQYDRMVMISSLVHESKGNQPIVVDMRTSIKLEYSQQPWRRRVTIDDEWQPLDIGWIPELQLGHIAIENREGYSQGLQPTPTEIATTAKRIVHISLSKDVNNYILLPPRQFVSFIPNIAEIYIRCASGQTAQIEINAFTR